MQISSEQHLVLYLCNAACNIVSETQRKEIINLVEKIFYLQLHRHIIHEYIVLLTMQHTFYTEI